MKIKNCKLILFFGLILCITACSNVIVPGEAPLTAQEYPNVSALPDPAKPADTTPSSISEESPEEDLDVMAESNEPIEKPSEKNFNAIAEPNKISSPKIVVKKSARILELWDGDTLFGTYSIGLGFNPVGHKAVQGDGRTPEGDYYVCTRNDESQFYRSLGVSYPNKEDAEAALDEEVIEAFTYQSIANSIDTKSRPPWDTPMGGAIMIHGHGSHEDWTEGCVAVDDDVMDILWEHCPINTPITILP